MRRKRGQGMARGKVTGWIEREGRRDEAKGYEGKWRRGWLGISIIVINIITINAAETLVRSSSELGFLLLHF